MTYPKSKLLSEGNKQGEGSENVMQQPLSPRAIPYIFIF